jgi:hypothetical protein|tara:strand:+ start:950 stop:1309 length:360 start_codon:yes stop_codon:yes gene_type:complete
MATVKTKLELQSQSNIAGLLSLNYNNDKSLTVGATSGSTASITTGNTEIVSTSASATTYVYITNPHASNSILLKKGDNVQWGIIHAGDWSFIAVPASIGLNVASSVGTISFDYIMMTKA